MGSRTPLHGGLLVAVLWLLLQLAIWTACLLATMFLSVVLVFLVGGTLDPTNWKGP